MYFAAQRVEAPKRNTEGINVLVYRHASILDQPVDFEAVARNPGPLLLQLSSIPPGGNTVTSYLDVVTPEQLTMAQIAETIDQLAAAYPDKSDPLDGWAKDRVHMRFYAHSYHHPDPPREFRRLKDRVLLVLGSGLMTGERRLAPIQPAPNPLRIHAQRDAHGTRYSLDAQSRTYVRRLRPEFEVPDTLGVTKDNEDHMRALYGADVYREFASILTGLTLDQINAVAGLRIYGPDEVEVWNSEQR
jgi:hypothetical protein